MKPCVSVIGTTLKFWIASKMNPFPMRLCLMAAAGPEYARSEENTLAQ